VNHTQHQLAVQNAAKKKLKGKTEVKSKTTPLYPSSAEREFQRISTGYMRLLHQIVKEHLPEVMAEYKEERYRKDDIQDLVSRVKQIFLKMAAELERAMAAYNLDSLVEKAAKTTQRSTLREWKRAVRETVGIDLFEDYYSGEFYQDTIQRWIAENVRQIKSLPTTTLGTMQQIVLDGFRNGQTIRDITKSIQDEYGVSKRKAKMLARDQVSTLNAQITKLQHQDAGCNKYRWSTSNDSRVRPCHRALNGQTFSWDDPPEMWYDTKNRGRVYTGRRCHPGEDFCCRCIAIPEFDIQTLDVPMKQKGQKANER